MTDRPLPSNPEAERAILGAILLDTTGFAYNQAVSSIQPGDFSLHSHRLIFARMVELFDAGKPINFVTLTDLLGQHDELVTVGGVTYVTSITDGIPRVKDIGSYVAIVKDKATLRSIIHLSDGAKEAAYEHFPSNRILNRMQENILTLIGDEKKGAAAKVGEFTPDTWKRLESRRQSTKEVLGMTTGVMDLDQRTMGIWKTELWVVGGRQNAGKTPLGLQIAAANCKRGTGVGIFSLEMKRHELLDRVWSADSGISYTRIRDPRMLSPDENNRLFRTVDRVSEWPLWIEDAESYSIAEIAARTRLLVRQHKIELVVIDYLQLVDAPGRDERVQMTKITKTLKRLAMAENIGIVGLSQLSRFKDHALNRRPNMHDLKESGSLESDANTVILTYMPLDQNDEPTGEDELIIGKQRSGRRGFVRMVMGDHMKWLARA